jgi:plastocyanin/endonuclease YncB( thermonuclease family)
MKSTHSKWLHGFVAVTMLLGLLGWTSLAEAAPAADVTGNTWESTLFPDCSITWTDTWFLVEEVSEDYDSVQLTDGVTFAQLVAAEEAGGNAVIELAAFSRIRGADPAVSNVQKMDDEPSLTSPEQSIATYSYTIDLNGDSFDVAEYVEARTLVPGSAVLLFLAQLPLELWESEKQLIFDLAAAITPGPGLDQHLDQGPALGESGPAFASGQWRVAVASASLNDSFDDLNLKAKDGKEWLVVIADVTNWSDNDGMFNARDFTVNAGLDGKTVKAARGSTKSVAKKLKLEPISDEITIDILAGQTQRVVIVYQVPAHSLELLLVRENAYLPVADALTTELENDDLAVPPETSLGELVSASDGRTVQVLIDGQDDAEKMRLLGVKPPAKSTCYDKEAKNALNNLVGQPVIVEQDAEVTDGSTPSRYIWLVNADGTRTLLNDQLISTGLATVDKIPSKARFGAWLRESERVAEAQPVGLWLDCADSTSVATEESTASATSTNKADRTATATPTERSTETSTTAATKSATASATSSGEGTSTAETDAQTTLNVKMRDISYDTVELVVPANSEITINLVNMGVATHTFNIDALDVHSGNYSFGQKGSVRFQTDEPGTYVFYCSNPGHKQAGMKGTLTVVGEVDL